MMDDEHQQIGPESAAPRHIPQHDRSPRMPAPDHTSTTHPPAIDIDALAAWLIEYRHPVQNALTRPDDGLTMIQTDRNFFVCHDALTDAAALVASDWLAGVIRSVKADAVREALTEIGERAHAGQDEVRGADFGTILTATVNAYSNACSDLLARVEAEASR